MGSARSGWPERLCMSLLLPAATVFALAGGTAQGAGRPGAGKPIVIGATISESGALTEDAGYQIKGLELGIAEANAHDGWLGRKLELKLYDDKSDPGTAVRLYTRLITNDQVDLLVGPYSSGITQAVAPLINKYKFATVEPGASMPDIYVQGNEWNFQGTAPSTQYLSELLPIAKQHGAKTVATVALKSAYSLACNKARVDQAKQLGMQVVYETTYSLPQPDFGAIALAIRNAHPDVVIGCTYYPDAVGLTKALHDQGFAPEFLAETIGPVEAAFIKAVGPLANGIISNTSWWSNFRTPGNSDFVAAYKARYHQDPEYHSATGYAAIQILGAAVQATHSLDQAKLREWLLTHSVPTIQGVFKSAKDGGATGFAQHLVQVQNGVIKLVTPPDLAQAKLQIPYSGK